jgi:hypothetical protein
MQVDGRKLSEYEYNVETLEHWPWGKAFQLMNSLKGGEPDVNELGKLILIYM